MYMYGGEVFFEDVSVVLPAAFHLRRLQGRYSCTYRSFWNSLHFLVTALFTLYKDLC